MDPGRGRRAAVAATLLVGPRLLGAVWRASPVFSPSAARLGEELFGIANGLSTLMV